MISIKRCRALLGAQAKNYTDEQIEQIRRFLIKMARINVEIIREQKQKEDEEARENNNESKKL